MKKFFANAYLWVILGILYAPIFIILIFSFTEAKVLGSWSGFSLNLYTNLFKGGGGHALNNAIFNTMTIAIIAAILSTLMGTIAAIGIFHRRKAERKILNFVNSIPMINPDIITGISLFLLFVFVGMQRGYATILCSHIAFCTPYVVLCVMPRLAKMTPNLYEAALDLGANPFQAFRKVLLPELRPGMLSGLVLSLTLSIDDFAVTFFTKGSSGVETLSTFIYADARKGGLTPELRPLFSLIFITILVLLIIYNVRTAKQSKKNIIP